MISLFTSHLYYEINRLFLSLTKWICFWLVYAHFWHIDFLSRAHVPVAVAAITYVSYRSTVNVECWKSTTDFSWVGAHSLNSYTPVSKWTGGGSHEKYEEVSKKPNVYQAYRIQINRNLVTTCWKAILRKMFSF